LWRFVGWYSTHFQGSVEGLLKNQPDLIFSKTHVRASKIAHCEDLAILELQVLRLW